MIGTKDMPVDTSPIQTSPAMAAAVRLTEVNYTLQAAIMKQIAQSQQQVAELLYELGVGQNVDIRI
jgi:hypothetical protein